MLEHCNGIIHSTQFVLSLFENSRRPCLAQKLVSLCLFVYGDWLSLRILRLLIFLSFSLSFSLFLSPLFVSLPKYLFLIHFCLSLFHSLPPHPSLPPSLYSLYCFPHRFPATVSRILSDGSGCQQQQAATAFQVFAQIVLRMVIERGDSQKSWWKSFLGALL